MIEIEKKFILTSAQEKHLKNGAKFLGEKVFTDIYFDKNDYELTKNDIWLRMRDKQIELKMPVETEGKKSKMCCNRYEEFVLENDVRQMLNLSKGNDLLGDLKNSGFRPFASITTRREKFKKDKFTIDIDACDFGYSIVEIELMVDDKTLISDAEKQIIAFAEKLNFSTKAVHGKVIEFLLRKSPEHYKILQEEGVIVG
jgi:predicted adenylyl cyclase CyaB